MRYRIRHYTEYSYNEPVNTCYNRLCLTPVNNDQHECLSSEISIVPTPDEISSRVDFFGNRLTFFSVYKEHKKLRINSSSVVNISKIETGALSAKTTVRWIDAAKDLSGPNGHDHEIVQYTLPSNHVPQSEVIKAFGQDCFTEGATLWAACNALMNKVYSEIKFKPGFTTVNTPVEAVVKMKKGVCQDLAHLMIAVLRNMGLAARYVSGYIETLPPPGKTKLVGADASHAWVSVYFPDIGWIEFDPTNNLLPSDAHIRVAYGRDYYDVAPMKGIVFNSGDQNLVVKVDVERLK